MKWFKSARLQPRTLPTLSEPIYSFFDGLSKWRELESRIETPEFRVACGLLVLPISLRSVINQLTLEIQSLSDLLCDVTNGNFIFFVH